MKKYFPRCRCYKYRFATPEIEKKFKQITQTKRKGVILYELRDYLSEYYDVSTLELVPRSKYAPDMLLEPARKYGEGGVMPAVHWSDLYTAVSRVKKKLCRVRGVKPIPLESVPFIGSSNSGLPYLTDKMSVRDETLRRAKACEQGACPPPMAMFNRGKNLEVVRMVLAGPAEWQLVEGRFFYPLQDALLRKESPYVAGVYSCTLGAKMNALTNHQFVLAMDYSGFDGSISAFLINSGFRILRRCLDLTEDDDRLFARIVSYFITAPILCPDGYVYVGKDHGVPSGSMFTQMIDSIVNMIIIEYVAIRTNLKIGTYYVLGDDSAVACDTEPNLNDIASAAREIGITVSPRKTRVTDTSRDLAVHFLGHTYVNGLPSRPVEETLSRLLCPERLDKRLFSKDPEVRREYYIERIRAYQEDNSASAAWRILRHLEVRVGYPAWDAARVHRGAEMDGIARRDFARVEMVERDRWDPKRHALRIESYGLFARPAVFWF